MTGNDSQGAPPPRCNGSNYDRSTEAVRQNLSQRAPESKRQEVGSRHGEQGARDRPGGWAGHSTVAAHCRPREAGSAIRWYLPAHRLRAVEPRQRWVPENRRPDAVQEPQSRPAHHHDVADVDVAGQLRDAGAGPTTGWSALVFG